MCEKHLGQCFVLTALHRLPSHWFHILFSKLYFFFLTVFKRELLVSLY